MKRFETGWLIGQRVGQGALLTKERVWSLEGQECPYQELPKCLCPKRTGVGPGVLIPVLGG